LTACSTTHHIDYVDGHHTQIKEHEASGDDGSDNRKYLAMVTNDSHNANYQGSGE